MGLKRGNVRGTPYLQRRVKERNLDTRRKRAVSYALGGSPVIPLIFSHGRPFRSCSFFQALPAQSAARTRTVVIIEHGEATAASAREKESVREREKMGRNTDLRPPSC
ncbi:hypothetical protein J3F84DRAFT_178953 [Trichoderma pleuroticola]